MAPESALNELRQRAADRARAAGKNPEERPGEAWERRAEELALLVEWAEENGIWFDANEHLPRVEATRGEHHVYFDPDRLVYVKITHGLELNAAGFALSVDIEDFRIGASQKFYTVPHLREATPFEYLARWVLFNRTFGDSVKIEGVIGTPGQEAMVINQPLILGEDASDEEIEAFMVGDKGFKRADCPPLGRAGVASQSFFRPSDYVAVFDTHGENFLVGELGVTPIDALIVADEYLANWLKLSPAERRAEGVANE